MQNLEGSVNEQFVVHIKKEYRQLLRKPMVRTAETAWLMERQQRREVPETFREVQSSLHSLVHSSASNYWRNVIHDCNRSGLFARIMS